MKRRSFMTAAAAAAVPFPAAAVLRKSPLPGIRIETALGTVDIALEHERAPLTVANFLRLVDAAAYAGAGSFYRSVAPGRDINPVPISVVQGGLGSATSPFAPIAHESTKATGLRHVDGTISMARGKVGTASSEFFLCLGDNPELDYGGKRAADGEGFAAFGRVVSGLDVVRAIHGLPVSDQGAGTAVAGQLLAEPVEILRTVRVGHG